MKELLLELQAPLLQILGILLMFLGYKLNALINERIESEQQEKIKNIVKGVVAFVEQVAKVDLELKGQEKFNLAKEKALEVLNAKGLPITDVELEILIEQFVNGLKGE